ncbi:MAG: ABC transporter substrate-binding protein, partial [Anaerolineae bacterium]
MQRGTHRWLTSLAAAALLLGVAACAPSGPEGGQGEATEAPTEETTGGQAKVPADQFVSVTIGEPESLDPAWTYETSGAGIESNVYEGLVAFKKDAPDEFVPALATSWEVSDDALTYTFNVRDGVTFHEGGTLEPSDIAYTLQRSLLQDRVDGPMWLLLKPFLGVSSIEDYAFELAGVERTDDATLADLPAEVVANVCEDVKAAVEADDTAGTVTLHVVAPTPWLLQLLAQPWGGAMDKEWMATQGAWDGDCSTWTTHHDPAQEDTVLFTAANGTGPYKLAKWEKGTEIVLEANENYWRSEPAWPGAPSGPPAIKRVVIQKVEEWGTRLAKLQAGEADTVSVPRANIDQVAALVHTDIEGSSDDAPSQVVNPDGTLKLYHGYPLVSATAAMFNFEVSTEGGNQFIGSGDLDGAGIPPDFFSDAHVRKGFSYCFDWETFIDDALKGEGIQTRGPIIEGLQGYRDDSEIYTFNLEKCGDELAQAWDGQLPDTGFQMTIAYNEGNEARQTVAQLLAENLAVVHEAYQVDTLSLEWPS